MKKYLYLCIVIWCLSSSSLYANRSLFSIGMNKDDASAIIKEFFTLADEFLQK